ncbi:MAG TPA: hypothetical protein VII73_09230 [Caulobacteraceae bacterium]
MAQIDIADAAMAGLKLTVRRPLTVLVWGALVVVYFIVLFAIFGGGLASTIASLASTPGASPAPQTILALVGSLLGFFFLLFLGVMVLGAVIMAAALRAELEPGSPGLAYLRFGAEELWLIAVNFVLWVVLLVAQMVMAIPLAILTFGMVIANFSPHPGFVPGPFVGTVAGAVGMRLIGQFLILGVTIWLWTRLSMGPVMSFRERQFRLFESWTLTKGHAWPIFLTMVLIFVMVIALEIVVYGLGAIAVLALVAPIPGIGHPQTFFSRPPGEWVALFAPAAAVVAILFVIIIGVANAMTWTAVGRIYRQLVPQGDAVPTLV